MTDRTRRQFVSDLGMAALVFSAGSALVNAKQAMAVEDQAEGGGPPGPTPLEAHSVAPDTQAITTFFPLPTLGLVPVNAFLIRGSQPVLIDTNLAMLSDAFMEKLRGLIDIKDIRWIWLTHTDADHTGSLKRVLQEAPQARLVTTFLGMGKLGLMGLPVDRAYLVNPGQHLDVGDRKLLAVKPPSYDAPETTGLLDTRTKALFPSDCFGALMQKPEENAADIAANDLRQGLVKWATVDAPWLHMVDENAFGKALQAVQRLEPSVVLSSHLPPATGMTKTLLNHLADVRTAQQFVGPDQAALEKMMSGAGD